MLKTLLKKQMLSFGNMLLMGNQKNKKLNIAMYALICVSVLFVAGMMCFVPMTMLAPQLKQAGTMWMLFLYAFIMAMLISVVLGAFMAQSQLYEAKDNELLLSLPIRPGYILLSRMLLLYILDFAFCAIIMLSAYINYALLMPVNALQVVVWILMLFLIPLLSVAINCLLGFLLMLITSKSNNKTLLSLLCAIVFLVLYAVVYSFFSGFINVILGEGGDVYAAQLGEQIKSDFPLVYAISSMFECNFVGIIIFAVLSIGAMALVYFVLSRTYIGLVTTKFSGAKKVYVEKKYEKSTQGDALLSKEFKRFFSLPAYCLNCGLGTIIMGILLVALIILNGKFVEIIAELDESLVGLLPVALAYSMSLFSMMNGVSAPSISLEGKTLWLLKSLPIDTWKMLKAKLRMHYLVTGPMATLVVACALVIIKAPLIIALEVIVVPSLAVVISGILGLVFNLLKPNLEWDNETLVIKQSMSVMLTMFSSIILLTVLFAFYYVLSTVILSEIAMLLLIALMVALCFVGVWWLKNYGCKIFAEL